MPIYFLIFLATLAGSLLLYLAAVVVVAITRRSPPAFIHGNAMTLLEVFGTALLWMNVGVAWLLYFNVYRIHVDMSLLGNTAFQAFCRGYTQRLPIVVLPYGVVCLAWTLALWGESTRVSRRGLWLIATLCIFSILSTPWAAGAQDSMHDHGFTDASYFQLQAAHLVRTLAISIAAFAALIQMYRSPPSLIPDPQTIGVRSV